MVTIRYKYDTLQETSERHTLNDKHENFFTTFLEAAAECILTKPKWNVEFPGSQKQKKWENMKKQFYEIKETQETPISRNLRKAIVN